MDRFDVIDCPEIMELGLMAASDPTRVEKIIARMLGVNPDDLKPAKPGESRIEPMEAMAAMKLVASVSA